MISHRWYLPDRGSERRSDKGPPLGHRDPQGPGERGATKVRLGAITCVKVLMQKGCRCPSRYAPTYQEKDLDVRFFVGGKDCWWLSGGRAAGTLKA